MTEQPEISDDLLRGATEIAEFLFGSRSPNLRRRVYHLIQTTNVPHFKLGSMVCARKSSLLKFVEDQEQRYANDNRPAPSKNVSNGKV